MALDANDIKHYASRLVARYSERDAMFEDIRRMFHMEWQEQPKADWIKSTMSPTAYNAAIGAIRLLTASEPQLSAPFDETDDYSRAVSEKMETAAKAMWNGSGRVSLRPAHYEVVFSAVLFGEVCASVTKTADLLRYAEASGNKASTARMKHVAGETPYLFKIYDPRTCYPEYDSFGLRSFLRRTLTTWGEVVDSWGKMALAAEPGAHENDEQVVVNDWWDWENRCVWVDRGGVTPAPSGGAAVSLIGGGTPILFEPHGLSFLPVVAQLAEGSFMFDKPENQRQPLLYALYKSGLWKRENLTLTVLYSLIFALGSNPLLKRKTKNPGQPLIIDRSMPAGVVDVEPDEDIGPFIEKIFDPSLLTGLDLAQRLNTESTIPKQALGGAPMSGMSFSAISLLAQSGRLPLTAPKQLGAAAISNMLIAALRWFKQDGGKEKFYRRGGYVELNPDEMPERVVIECTLEPDLPQDRLQQLHAAALAKNLKLAPKRWIRENFLSIGQSGNIDKEIWMEDRVDAELQALLAKLQAKVQLEIQAQAQQQQAAMQQAQQAQAQAMQQQVGGGMGGGAPMPGGGMPPGGQAGAGAPQGMSEEEMAMQMAQSSGENGALPPGGEVGPGQPLNSPLPPRWQG
jgi:hypothetical protein